MKRWLRLISSVVVLVFTVTSIGTVPFRDSPYKLSPQSRFPSSDLAKQLLQQRADDLAAQINLKLKDHKAGTYSSTIEIEAILEDIIRELLAGSDFHIQPFREKRTAVGHILAAQSKGYEVVALLQLKDGAAFIIAFSFTEKKAGVFPYEPPPSASKSPVHERSTNPALATLSIVLGFGAFATASAPATALAEADTVKASSLGTGLLVLGGLLAGGIILVATSGLIRAQWNKHKLRNVWRKAMRTGEPADIEEAFGKALSMSEFGDESVLTFDAFAESYRIIRRSGRLQVYIAALTDIVANNPDENVRVAAARGLDRAAQGIANDRQKGILNERELDLIRNELTAAITILEAASQSARETPYTVPFLLAITHIKKVLGLNKPPSSQGVDAASLLGLSVLGLALIYPSTALAAGKGKTVSETFFTIIALVIAVFAATWGAHLVYSWLFGKGSNRSREVISGLTNPVVRELLETDNEAAILAARRKMHEGGIPSVSSAVKEFIKVAEDKSLQDHRIRKRAIVELVCLEDPLVVERLRRILEEGVPHSLEEHIKTAIVKVFTLKIASRVNNPGAQTVVGMLVKAGNEAKRASLRQVWLREKGDLLSDTVSILLEIAESDLLGANEIRIRAIEELGELADASCVARLRAIKERRVQFPDIHPPIDYAISKIESRASAPSDSAPSSVGSSVKSFLPFLLGLGAFAAASAPALALAAGAWPDGTGVNEALANAGLAAIFLVTGVVFVYGIYNLISGKLSKKAKIERIWQPAIEKAIDRNDPAPLKEAFKEIARRHDLGGEDGENNDRLNESYKVIEHNESSSLYIMALASIITDKEDRQLKEYALTALDRIARHAVAIREKRPDPKTDPEGISKHVSLVDIREGLSHALPELEKVFLSETDMARMTVLARLTRQIRLVLGYSGPVSHKLIIGILKDEKAAPNSRFRAISALVSMKDTLAIPDLLEVAESQASIVGEMPVDDGGRQRRMMMHLRVACIGSIGEIGTTDGFVIASIVRFCSRKQHAVDEEENSAIRLFAIRALTQIGNLSHIPILQGIVVSDPDPRIVNAARDAIDDLSIRFQPEPTAGITAETILSVLFGLGAIGIALAGHPAEGAALAMAAPVGRLYKRVVIEDSVRVTREGIRPATIMVRIENPKETLSTSPEKVKQVPKGSRIRGAVLSKTLVAVTAASLALVYLVIAGFTSTTFINFFLWINAIDPMVRVLGVITIAVVIWKLASNIRSPLRGRYRSRSSGSSLWSFLPVVLVAPSLFGCAAPQVTQQPAEVDSETALINRLITTLQSTDLDRDVRSEAASSLGEMGAASAVPALLGIVTNTEESGHMRMVAATALGRIGTEAASAESALIEIALKDKHSGVRTCSARALRKISPDVADRAVTAFIEGLNHPDAGVRKNAADALRKTGRQAARAIPVLEMIAEHDPIEGVKEAAARAIKEIQAAQQRKPDAPSQGSEQGMRLIVDPEQQIALGAFVGPTDIRFETPFPLSASRQTSHAQGAARRSP